MIKGNKVYLSIGSNIGDRESNIAQAISAIEVPRENYNLNSASFYLTEPLYNTDQELFINTVVGLDSEVDIVKATPVINTKFDKTENKCSLTYCFPGFIDFQRISLIFY